MPSLSWDSFFSVAFSIARHSRFERGIAGSLVSANARPRRVPLVHDRLGRDLERLSGLYRPNNVSQSFIHVAEPVSRRGFHTTQPKTSAADPGISKTIHEATISVEPPDHVRSQRLLKILEEGGFTSDQASAVLSALEGAVTESLGHRASHYVPKHLRESQLDDTRTMDSLRERIKALQAAEATSLARDLAKVRTSFAAVSSSIPEQSTRASSGIRLDLNLEKGRIRDEEAKLAAQIEVARKGMEKQVQELRGRIEGIKRDVDEALIGGS